MIPTLMKKYYKTVCAVLACFCKTYLDMHMPPGERPEITCQVITVFSSMVRVYVIFIFFFWLVSDL